MIDCGPLEAVGSITVEYMEWLLTTSDKSDDRGLSKAMGSFHVGCGFLSMLIR